jgi:hypothetical protein
MDYTSIGNCIILAIVGRYVDGIALYGQLF